MYISGKISLVPILAVNFIGMLAYSIIIPFLVFLVDRYGGNGFIYGLMGATYPAFQFFGSIILGKWSDRYGRRKILLLSHAGTLLAWLFFILILFLPITIISVHHSTLLGSFSITVPLLFLFFARAIDGLTGGNISVANAYLADISTNENRNSNFGKMAMSSSLGFIIGPALAGLLGATEYKELVPVTTAAFISLIALYLIWFRLPESKKSPIKEKNEIISLSNREILALPNILFMVSIYFLTFLAFNFFYAAFPLHALKNLSWDSFQLGIFFSFLSGIMILVQGPLLKKLSKTFNEAVLVVSGSFFLAINFALMGLADSVLLLYIAAILFALGNGLMWPSYLSLLAKLAGNEYQGTVQGFANSSGSLASIIGLLGGGYLYGILGTYTFFITAFILLIIMLLSFKMLRFISKP